MACAPASPMPRVAIPAAACSPASSCAWPDALCDHHCVNIALVPSNSTAAADQNTLHDASVLPAGNTFTVMPSATPKIALRIHGSAHMRRRRDAISRAASKPAPAATTLTPHASAIALKVKSWLPPSRDPSSAKACVDHKPVPTAIAPASTQPHPSRLSRERAVFSACINTPAVSNDTSVASNNSKGWVSTSITAAERRGYKPGRKSPSIVGVALVAPKGVTVTDATRRRGPQRVPTPRFRGGAALSAGSRAAVPAMCSRR
jgi:hypothetical protein